MRSGRYSSYAKDEPVEVSLHWKTGSYIISGTVCYGFKLDLSHGGQLFWFTILNTKK